MITLNANIQPPPMVTDGKSITSNTIRTIVCILIIVLISGLYLRFAWNKYQAEMAAEATILVQSLGSLLPRDQIAELTGGPEDLNKPAYIMLKHNLIQLVDIPNIVRFAYLLGEKDGNLIILLDSEPSDSLDYSPPGQVYEEADDIIWEPFKRGNPILTSPITDRWGTWISALEPIKDLSDGSVIAAFGIYYSAAEWNSLHWKRMIPDMLIILCLILLSIALLRIWNQHTSLKNLTKRLTIDEALYRSIFDQAPIGIAIINDKNHLIQSEFGDMSINRMYEHITGWKKSDLQKRTWLEITHPEDLPADLYNFDQYKSGKNKGYSLEKRFVRSDGSSVWTNMKISSFIGMDDNQALHLCILEDISTRKESEESLKESERNKSVLLSHLPGLAYRCNYDRNWTMQYVSSGCFELTGYTSDSLLYNKDISYNDLITPKYRELLSQEWERTLRDRLPFRYEYEITTANGQQKWILELGEGIFNGKDEVEALEGIVIDITDRKELENKLLYNNEHDRWTGLYNRYYLEKQLIEDFKHEPFKQKAFVGINLGITQTITAAYGFNYTQELLKKIAEVLSQYSFDGRFLFYTYWDRFVFYLKDYRDKSELLEFADDIAIELEVLLKAERLNSGIGIIEINQDFDSDTDSLLKKLLIASESAINKTDRRVNICYFDTEMEDRILREEVINSELSQIADGELNGGLFLQYQPILDIKLNQICGFEALARINSDILGLISPLEFIPLAEKTKLIIPIGQKIIREAFCFINTLKDSGYNTLVVNINVSAIQLLGDNFTENLFETIREMQINPENVGFELTESIFAMDYERINEILTTIKDAGMYIAIDDFGTGYSSLARERELNVDCLKIDKYFIDKLLEIHPGNTITGDIISMAHKMGHCALAEGVEYEEQKQYLIDNGCDKIQGYLISRPLDKSAAIEFLK